MTLLSTSGPLSGITNPHQFYRSFFLSGSHIAAFPLSAKFGIEHLQLSVYIREKEVRGLKQNKTHRHRRINSLHIALLHKNLHSLNALQSVCLSSFSLLSERAASVCFRDQVVCLIQSQYKQCVRSYVLNTQMTFL